MEERAVRRRVRSVAHREVTVIAFVLLLLGTDRATAGPPFLTDDPEPVELRHWEVYVGSQGARDRVGWSGTAPHVELNYGPARNVQLHLIAPLVLVLPAAGRSAYGYGDTELGLKVRLLQETPSHPQVGTFPIMEVPSRDARIETGGGDVQLFIPIWIQKSLEPWTTYCGGGYWTDVDGLHQHWWFLGWEAQRKLSRAVTAGGELFHETAKDEASEPETGFNLGLILDLSELQHMLVSAGRDFEGPNRLQGYVAYQLTFGR
jgi:hypothetical protein